MNDFDKILTDLDVEIDEIDLYGYGIIETSLSMVRRLQSVLNDLREKIQTYVFPSKEDEILFFKTQRGCPKSRIAPFAIVYFGKKYYLTVAKTKHYSNG